MYMETHDLTDGNEELIKIANRYRDIITAVIYAMDGISPFNEIVNEIRKDLNDVDEQSVKYIYFKK
jgi:hypothetical protein